MKPLVAGALLISGAVSLFAAEKPNIILMLSDDVGLGNIGCYGGPFKTPQLDALARGGLRFDNCYSTPLCGPSRCQLLTGHYPFRTGLINNQSRNAIQPGRESMIPAIMKQAGYVTASVGKWGQMSFGPGEWGFDEYLVFPGSGRYWREQTTRYTVNGQQKTLAEGAYLPDLMHEFIVDFLTRHKDQPFFLYYPMSHIHGPIVRTPDSRPGADKDRLYADNVQYMDNLAGKLVAELERLHLREKTLLMFTGDNGTARFGVDAAKVHGRPISGAKGSMLEGGSHVPLIVNWPGVTPPNRVCRDLVDFSDFFATCAEIGGGQVPPGSALDSHSFAAQIKGLPGRPREWVYVELNGKSYARDKRFKLADTGALFDLSEAPYKEIPVAVNSADPAVLDARTRLQKVLDTHPARKAGSDENQTPARQKKKARKRLPSSGNE